MWYNELQKVVDFQKKDEQEDHVEWLYFRLMSCCKTKQKSQAFICKKIYNQMSYTLKICSFLRFVWNKFKPWLIDNDYQLFDTTNYKQL